jgi:hypothetical protein
MGDMQMDLTFKAQDGNQKKLPLHKRVHWTIIRATNKAVRELALPHIL